MRQEQDTIPKNQLTWKKTTELLEVKNVFIEIKCSTGRFSIRLGTTEDRINEQKAGPEKIQNAAQRDKEAETWILEWQDPV